MNDKGPLAFSSSSFAGYARSDRPLRGSRTDYASGGNHCRYLALPYLVGRGALIGPGALMGRGALIGRGALMGAGGVIMRGALIGAGGLIGRGALKGASGVTGRGGLKKGT